MIFGIPGLSTLFYVLSVLVMPVTELAKAVHGRSTWQRWRTMLRHVAIVAAIVTCVWLVAERYPAIGALRRDGVLYDTFRWAQYIGGGLLVLLVLAPWLVRVVRRAYHFLGWACAHSRHPHPTKPHPSILAELCPDCGRLMFQVQEKLSLSKMGGVVKQA
ncbi:hypothetical protein [Streptomyces sp. NPDC051219]|uniref:hypothetical protein n=1 Tax=Streptomyces sp. NPDC051219 TaxID=3155283 RepID=UPI0034474426